MRSTPMQMKYYIYIAYSHIQWVFSPSKGVKGIMFTWETLEVLKTSFQDHQSS